MYDAPSASAHAVDSGSIESGARGTGVGAVSATAPATAVAFGDNRSWTPMGSGTSCAATTVRQIASGTSSQRSDPRAIDGRTKTRSAAIAAKSGTVVQRY